MDFAPHSLDINLHLKLAGRSHKKLCSQRKYRGIDDVAYARRRKEASYGKTEKTISRPYRITVRFTDMEYGLITDAAEETGVTLSEYIRKMVLEGKIAIRYEVVADIPELQKLTAEFGKIGSNLNQVARHFNSGGIHSQEIKKQSTRGSQIFMK